MSFASIIDRMVVWHRFNVLYCTKLRFSRVDFSERYVLEGDFKQN